MARIPYKAYDNKWKYGKGIGLTVAFATGYIVFQQIQVSNSSTYVMKDGYDSPIYGVIFVAGIILFIVSSFMNKQVAVAELQQRNEAKLNRLFERLKECIITQGNNTIEVQGVTVNLVDEMKNAEIKIISDNIPLQQNETHELIFPEGNSAVKIVDAKVLSNDAESAVIKCTLKNIMFVNNEMQENQ